MNLEEMLKRLWQTQFSRRRPRLNEAPLLQKVEREERSFRLGQKLMVLLSCGLLVVLGWLFYQAMKTPPPQPAVPGPSLIWPALIMALPLTGLAVFITVDLLRSRWRQPRPEEPAKAFARSLLAQIDHQIRLSRKIFWWFILPIICVADFGFRCYMAWWVGAVTGDTNAAVSTVLRAVLECAVVGTAIFYLFRWLVNRHLQPRKEQVQALLRTLEA